MKKRKRTIGVLHSDSSIQAHDDNCTVKALNSLTGFDPHDIMVTLYSCK